MSNLYNLEPQPTAKVVLHTTSGDILLELFGKQTPLATRNFLQLCLDGYYDNTVFHRLVPGFIIQGGDPTGTGSGGESSYNGDPFADEFHPRLKFNRRGLLGMANTGQKNDNGSQFFLTLGKTDELIEKNTMFGRVMGDTIYNLVKMGEAELTEEEGSDRPMYPTRVTGTEILVNPFEDMVKRVRIAERVTEEKQPKKKVKKKSTKTLLSFGDDDGGEEEVQIRATAKYNPDLINTSVNGSSNASKRSAPTEKIAERPSKRLATSQSPSTSPPPAPSQPTKAAAKRKSPSRSPSPASDSEPETSRDKKRLDRTNAKIEELKASLRRPGIASERVDTTKRKVSALEAMIPSTATRGRRRNPAGGSSASATAGEKRALDELNAFRKRLAANPAPFSGEPPRNRKDSATTTDLDVNGKEKANDNATVAASNPTDADEELCDLHFLANCESCKAWEGGNPEGGGADDEDDDPGAWMSHKLSFARERRGRAEEWRRRGEEELMVVDPVAKGKEIAGEHRRKKKERREERRKG